MAFDAWRKVQETELPVQADRLDVGTHTFPDLGKAIVCFEVVDYYAETVRDGLVLMRAVEAADDRPAHRIIGLVVSNVHPPPPTSSYQTIMSGRRQRSDKETT